MDFYILKDKKTIQCTLEEKIEHLKNNPESYKDHIVKQERSGEWFVSTVFLEMDVALETGAPPILFETMVFKNDETKRRRQYGTWEEAMEGHKTLAAQYIKSAKK